VAIHAGPGSEAPGYSGEVLNQMARFAVPFFFCVSGFLFARSCQHDSSVRTLWRYEKRIVSLHLFWSVFYFLNPSVTAVQALGWFESYRVRWQNLIADPLALLLESTALHLWFLSSLIISLPLIWLVNRRSPLPGVFLGAALFIVALLAGPYRGSPITIELGFNPRNGPLFSMVFIALGFLTGSASLVPGRRLAWSLFLLGGALQAFELIRLHLEFGASPFGFNFVGGTLLFGYGAFLLAINSHPSDRFRNLARLGPLATGIYCVHVFFVKKVDFFDVFFPEAWWGFVRTVLVFALALLASMVLAKIPPLKRFVT
jgi:surface polysaccharide O-acyltransferase-like enzyme